MPAIDPAKFFQSDAGSGRVSPGPAKPAVSFALLAGRNAMVLVAVAVIVIFSGVALALKSHKQAAAPDDTAGASSTGTNIDTTAPTDDYFNDVTGTAPSPSPATTPATTNSPPPGPSSSPAPSPSPAPTPAPTPPPASYKPQTYTIRYTNQCFSPANYTIQKSDTIIFINDTSNKGMWPAADPHPSHSSYPDFDPKQVINPGASWPFTFNRAGSWGYHDHLKPSCTGTITVK